VRHPAELALSDVERSVLDLVPTGGASLDDVLEATGLPASQVLAALSALEIRRLVRRTSGSQVARV
jgi:DNA processing protein